VSSKLRIILIVVAVLVVLVLILPFLIPVNQFRPTIEQKASAALGRKVDVGNLSFSLLGGSLSAENLSIGDDPKFSPSPFLTAKSLKVGVEIMPLIFSKTLNITGVTIVDPQVTLLRNPAGQWNYSSMGGAAAAQPAAKTSSSAPAGDFSVKQFDLKNGKIVIGSTTSQKRSTYDHVDVSASNVSATTKFPLKVSADLPGGGKFKLDGDAGPVDAADSSLTPVDAKLEISGMNLATSGVLDPSAGLGGLLDLNATVNSQGGAAQVAGTAKLSKALLVAGGSPATEPVNVDFNTKYDLRKNSGILNASTLKIGNATTNLSGTYATSGDNTVLNIKVDGQNMPAQDLVSFLPALGINMPKGATLQGGTLSTSLNLTGPTNRMITTGNVGLYSAKLAGFDLGSKMSAISALTGVKSGKDLAIEKITTNLRMAPDGLKADNFNAVLPALGNVVGGGTVDAKNNLDFKMAATLTDALGTMASPVSGAANGLGGIMGKVGGGGGGAGGCKNGTTIPFMIEGTTSDPKFIPDAGGLAAGMVKSQLGCVGGLVPGAGKGQTPNPSNLTKGLGGLFGGKKP
jgi:AsmA protein